MTDHQNNPRSKPHKTSLFVYGTQDCPATRLVRNYLDKLEIPYTYVDLDTDADAAKQVRKWTGGPLTHPTLQAGKTVVIEPDMRGLQILLEENGMV